MVSYLRKWNVTKGYHRYSDQIRFGRWRGKSHILTWVVRLKVVPQDVEKTVLICKVKQTICAEVQLLNSARWRICWHWDKYWLAAPWPNSWELSKQMEMKEVRNSRPRSIHRVQSTYFQNLGQVGFKNKKTCSKSFLFSISLQAIRVSLSPDLVFRNFVGGVSKKTRELPGGTWFSGRTRPDICRGNRTLRTKCYHNCLFPIELSSLVAHCYFVLRHWRMNKKS